MTTGQDGPNTHKYTTANHITTWTVIPLYDPATAVKHWYHVPTVLVNAIEQGALNRPDVSPAGVLGRLRNWLHR